MQQSVPFEWLTIEDTKTKKITSYAGIYIETILEDIPCYWQLDTGCSRTMIAYDFLTQYKVLKNNVQATDVYIYGPNREHIKEVSIFLPTLNRPIVIPYCFIEHNLTQHERPNEKEILKKKLPFAGYLGMDFFEGKNFAIDFPQQKIFFSTPSLSIENTNNLRFFKSGGCIILPIHLNDSQAFALFDTATANTPLFLENQLFETITQHSIATIPHKKLVRPDFSFNSYFLEYFIRLEIGAFEIKQTAILETPDKERNAYFFTKSKAGCDIVLGNFFFRNSIIHFDFENNVFSIK